MKIKYTLVEGLIISAAYCEGAYPSCHCRNTVCTCSGPIDSATQVRDINGSPKPYDDMLRNRDSPIDEDVIMFDDPKDHDKLVDWCLSWDNNCGQPAADFFCAEKGYGPAYEFSRRTVYDTEGDTTLHLYEHSTCNPEHHVCHAFDYIACTVLEQTYYNPTVHGYALDGCYRLEKGCGFRAADAYCNDRGYGKSRQYAIVEAKDETMYIGNHVVCNPDHHPCNTFDFITCYTPTGSAKNQSPRTIQRGARPHSGNQV